MCKRSRKKSSSSKFANSSTYNLVNSQIHKYQERDNFHEYPKSTFYIWTNPEVHMIRLYEAGWVILYQGEVTEIWAARRGGGRGGGYILPSHYKTV